MTTRPQGRLTGQMRTIEIIPDFIKQPQGSVLIKTGNTWVLCAATVEEKVPPFLKGLGSGWVTAEYSLMPASTLPRSVREASRGKINGRTSEIQRLIGRSLRAVVDMSRLGERTVWVDCDVLQADGGTRTAAVTGSFVAVYLALHRLHIQGIIDSFPIKDYLAAVSVGLVEGVPCLDLEYIEDSQAQVDMNVVMTGKGEFVEIQGTGENSTFSREQMDIMLRLAEKGIGELIELQKQALGQVLEL